MIQRERKGVLLVPGHVLAEKPSWWPPPNGSVTKMRRRASPIRWSGGSDQPWVSVRRAAIGYGRFSGSQPLTGVMPVREMLNPLPPVTVQVMASTVEMQRNGPTPVESP